MLRARNSKRIPQFLKLETPDIKFAIFPHEEIASLRTEFRNALDKISEELLALTIKARENIDADLRRSQTYGRCEGISQAKIDRSPDIG